MTKKALRVARWGLRGLALSGVVAWAAAAGAQARDPVAAEALFREGRDLAKKGDWPTACVRFDASFRLDPSMGSLLNLADCEQHIGKVGSSWQHFRQLMQNLPADDERVTFARQRIAELEPRLPRVTISIAPAAPKGTHVTRDQVELSEGSLGIALPVDPGAHVIIATATNHKSRRYDFEIKEKETQLLVVEPGEEEEAPPTPSGAASIMYVGPPPAQPLSRAATAGYVIGGVGLASIVIGGVAGIIVLDKKNTVEGDCHGSSQCDSEAGVSAARTGKNWAIVSTGAFALGVVAVASGAYLVLSERARASAVAQPTTGGATFSFRKEFLAMRVAGKVLIAGAVLAAIGCADIVGADFGARTVKPAANAGGSTGKGGGSTGGSSGAGGAGCQFECCSNLDCFTQHNAPYICRNNACLSLTTPECAEVVGDGYKDDNVFLFGYLDTLSGPASQTMAGLNHAAAAKLAAKDFKNTVSGAITSGDGTLAPLSMIICDEAAGNAAKSGKHLIDDLGVKAILGPTFDTAYKDYLNNYANTGKAFLLSSSTENPDFPGLNSMGLGWSCSPNIRAYYPMMWHEVLAGEKAVRERRKLPASKPVRLLMVAAGDPASQAGNIQLIQGMTINGKPVTDQPDDFLYFSYGDPMVVNVDYGKLVATIVAFKPDLILPYGGPDLSATIMPLTELEYTSTPFEERPIWMAYFVEDSAFVDLACGKGATSMMSPNFGMCLPPNVNDFRRRIFGFGSVPENVKLRVAFSIGFKAENNNQAPLPFTAATYDSYYVLAYALQAAAAADKATKVKDLTPAQIAGGIAKLIPPDGTESVEVGADNIAVAMGKLQAGGAINLEGASGHLDFQTKPLFDSKYGMCAPGNTLQLWCIAPDTNFVGNGEIYDPATDTFGAPKFPIYECQKP